MENTENELSEKDFENPLLNTKVEPDNSLKEMFVDYVGLKLKPENNEVTLQMIIDVLGEEFPEFLLSVAEENFIRGYEQAFADMENNEVLKSEQDT